MTSEIKLKLLEKQIEALREELNQKVEHNMNNLSCPEVLAVNHEIDKLLVTYLKLTIK